MYLIKENAVLPVKLKHVPKNGLVDERLLKIETLVADNFNVTVTSLDCFYLDTDAKIMCCFLVHDLLSYSINSIANRYHIYPAFLQKKISEHYIRCLQDECFFNYINSLKITFKK